MQRRGISDRTHERGRKWGTSVILPLIKNLIMKEKLKEILSEIIK